MLNKHRLTHTTPYHIYSYTLTCCFTQFIIRVRLYVVFIRQDSVYTSYWTHQRKCSAMNCVSVSTTVRAAVIKKKNKRKYSTHSDTICLNRYTAVNLMMLLSVIDQICLQWSWTCREVMQHLLNSHTRSCQGCTLAHSHLPPYTGTPSRCCR